MSAAHELPALVTVDDAAASLALHPDHVRRLVRTGELVGYRLGRAVRVEAASVRDYAARCRLHVVPSQPGSTSTAPTSSDGTAAPTGTPAGGASRKTESRSGRKTAPRQSDACANDSTPLPADPWTRLRAKYRSPKR
jgi:excisionase family DNA binding protein